MPQRLNNVTCGDDYTAAATAIFHLPTFKVDCIVANQAVYYQVEKLQPNMQTGTGVFTDEAFQIPGTGSIIRPYLMGGIRFKNSSPTAIRDAQVSAIEA